MESETQIESGEKIGRLKNIYDLLNNVSWFISAYAALATFAIVKTFALDIVRVNNKDMLATYSYGDALLVKKIFNTYSTNDVIYFQYPLIDSSLGKTYLVQRVFGLPGDSFEIKNKIVFINGSQIQDTSTVKQNYFVTTIERPDSTFREKYDLIEGGEISSSMLEYSFSLMSGQAAMLRADSNVKSVEIKGEKDFGNDESCFPSSTLFPWNSDFYGKIYVPKRNDTLLLDTVSLKIYASIISQHEKNDLRLRNDSIFINGELTNEYVTKKNYYFVLGDNRGNANDSRNWGYLPENLIVGKVVRTVRRMK